MNRNLLENTTKGNLTEFNGHKNLLVSFGGIQQGLGVPNFEFFKSISDIPCDKIFLRDFNQAWYQKGVDSKLNHIDKLIEYLEKTIKDNHYQNICFLGNSMGGYAAILFGSILNVNSVISFAPQTFINPLKRIIYRDKRWSNHIDQVYKYHDKRKEYFDLKKLLKQNNNYQTQLNIYYSPIDILDKRHAERLRKEKNVNLHSIQEGGHSVAKALRNTGQLQNIIQNIFN